MLLYLKVNTYYVNKIKCTADIGGGVRQVGVGGGGVHGCSGGVAGHEVRCRYVSNLVIVELGVLKRLLHLMCKGSEMRRCNLAQ